MESLLVEEEVLSRQTEITTEMGHNFWSGRSIAFNVLHWFPKAVFLEVPMQSLLVEHGVLSRKTGITDEKGHNFWSYRWITLKALQLFPEPVFLEVTTESLHVKKEANAKIDSGKDTLSMEVGDEKIEFNFHDAMKYPYSNVYSITCYDQIDKFVQQVCDFDCEDGLSIALSYGYDFTKIDDVPWMIRKSATMNLTKMDEGWVWLCCLSFGV